MLKAAVRKVDVGMSRVSAPSQINSLAGGHTSSSISPSREGGLLPQLLMTKASSPNNSLPGALLAAQAHTPLTPTWFSLPTQRPWILMLQSGFPKGCYSGTPSKFTPGSHVSRLTPQPPVALLWVGNGEVRQRHVSHCFPAWHQTRKNQPH